MHKPCFSMFLCIFILSSIVRGQQNLQPQQQIQYLNAAAQAANEELQQGNRERGKLILFSSTNLAYSVFQKFGRVPQVQPLIQNYVNACQNAWQNGPSLDGQTLAKALQEWESAKTEIISLGQFYNWEAGSLPSGQRRYYQRISEMITRREDAWKKAEQVTGHFPSPIQIMQNQQVFRKLWSQQIFTSFFYITFGPSIALVHAQQRVVPETLKHTKTQLAKAKSATKAGDIWHVLAEAQLMTTILSNIESSTRKEKDVDFSSLRQELSSFKKEIDTQNKRAIQLKNAEIDSNRIPADSWRGDNRQTIVQQIRKIYHQLYPGEKIERISIINEDWGERWESWWEETTLLVAYLGYIKVAIAAKHEDGTHYVHVKWFRRTRQTDGSWSPLSLYEAIYDYRIRSDNIDK